MIKGRIANEKLCNAPYIILFGRHLTASTVVNGFAIASNMEAQAKNLKPPEMKFSPAITPKWAENRSVWKTIRDNFRRFARQFDIAYEGINPDSLEGQMLREMKGRIG